jgi:hypothetical protein
MRIEFKRLALLEFIDATNFQRLLKIHFIQKKRPNQIVDKKYMKLLKEEILNIWKEEELLNL